MKPAVHTTNSPMDLLSHVSKNSSIHCSMPSTVVQIQGLHYSTSRPPQLMPNLPHPLRCCTTARYILPYHLGSTILTLQPYRFKGILRTKPSMPSPMPISALSAPFYAGQLIATFDTPRKISIPATVVPVFPKNSCQVLTAYRTIYYHTRCHLWECSVRCNDAEPKAPSATSEQASHQVSQTCAAAYHKPSQ